MNGFFTTIGPGRVRKTDPLFVKSHLGVMVDGSFVQPPRCEVCHGHIELGTDWEEGLVVCQDCGREARIFRYERCPIEL